MQSHYGFIYVTYNTVNGKRYIGKKTYDSYGKWRNYLGSGIVLKRAISKYGKDAFRREIIDIAESSDELNLKEKKWITFYHAVEDANFYNCAEGGNGGNVRSGYSEKHFLESEGRRKEMIRANIRRGEDAGPSILTESEVNTIVERLLQNEFPRDIAKDYNVSCSTIMDIRCHKTWTHVTAGVEFDQVSDRKRPHPKKVSVYRLDGEFVGTYKSARDASAILGVGYRMISQVCNHQRKSAHGYYFEFYDPKRSEQAA